MNGEECYVNFNFRYRNEDIFELRQSLSITEEMICYNNIPVDEIEALRILLKCLRLRFLSNCISHALNFINTTCTF